ncbi:hypothetical protein [Pseudomonas sp. URMO17WK12:I11]|uniref:hypothetical protein n=1 Tax=Pseudomonas sp. URMO17WK12:I11 TaxID=1283291 RepID=UPI0015B51018|nr:hypothetical protein [Pseudomonas sp. URMO17WK12:I11]
MKGLEEEKAKQQQEKIDQLRNLTDEEREQLNREGQDEKQGILDRFTNKKPPRGRLD